MSEARAWRQVFVARLIATLVVALAMVSMAATAAAAAPGAGGVAGAVGAAGGAGGAGAAAAPPATQVIDDFRDLGRWQPSASDQVRARTSAAPGGGLCLHYDFGAVSGYAVARRTLALQLPAHYRLRLKLWGEGPPNAVQLKFVDASGDNVWWRHWRDLQLPARPSATVVRQRQIEFAWGPTEDKTLRQAAALELVVASGRGGGAGRVCIAALELDTLPPPAAPVPPVLTQGPQGSLLTLGAAPQEFNGLLWRWAGPRHGAAQVQASDDGRRWRTLHRLPPGQRDWQALWLPDQEARFVRITGATPALELRAPGPADWPDRNAMLGALAAQAPRSHHPRAFHGEQNYWTIVGTDGGGAHAALLSEDGAVEPARGGPSLEPLLLDAQGRPIGWAEVQAVGERRTTLREGHLPLPAVEWRHPQVALRIEAAADGDRSQAALLLRYTVHNPLPTPQALTLALQLRPWQVNPPQQFLNTPGGVAEVRQLAWQAAPDLQRPQAAAGQRQPPGVAGTLQVDGRPWLHTLEAPAQVLATPFDAGDVLGPAAAPLQTLRDPQALASASLRWPLQLAAGERRSIRLLLPLAGQPPRPADAAAFDARIEAVAADWRQRLNRVRFTLPPEAQPLHDSLRAGLSHILMSRDGPALQPGTRSYARSWIRDGAMMVAGLLRLGELQAAREFTTWYATKLFADGKVPCCVDARGADPVDEHDSHGQFIFSVAELWRHTGDRALLQQLWPQVDAAARHLDVLRQRQRTAAYQTPERAAFFGTLPPSISHEGYSAKPMHSYWDMLWALAGWRDATQLAQALGLQARAAELAAQQAEFRAELAASYAATVAMHRIGHLPGAVELGDFDPNSSSMIFSPAGAEDMVPPALLQATWQRWWDESQRRIGSTHWNEYTPYELRSVSAVLRLGWPERAHAMLRFFLADQRPAGWQHWAEVVERRPRHPRFVGDMPHAWIASDFIRSALDLLAYERERDGALVLAAGVPASWLAQGPVGVQGLGTAFGPLGYTLQRGADGGALLQLAAGLKPPPGGLWLAWGGALHRVPDGALQFSLPAAAPAAATPTATTMATPTPTPTPTATASATAAPSGRPAEALPGRQVP